MNKCIVCGCTGEPPKSGGAAEEDDRPTIPLPAVERSPWPTYVRACVLLLAAAFAPIAVAASCLPAPMTADAPPLASVVEYVPRCAPAFAGRALVCVDGTRAVTVRVAW